MLKKTNIYQAGNTIKLQCIFKDFEENNISPQKVKIVFYNYKYEKIDEVHLTNENEIATGVYEYYYASPTDSEKRIIYEWYGEINGYPTLKRGQFRTVFI